MVSLAIIHGPNLNLVGTREPAIYGNISIDEYLQSLSTDFPQISLTVYQSNIEGLLIDQLHRCRGAVQGVILNAGAYSHTSIALADAIAAIGLPVVEVHISNVLAREDFRKHSFIASKCVGSISGLGLYGYRLAVDYFVNQHE